MSDEVAKKSGPPLTNFSSEISALASTVCKSKFIRFTELRKLIKSIPNKVSHDREAEIGSVTKISNIRL